MLRLLLSVRFKLFLNFDIILFVNIKLVDIFIYVEGIIGKFKNFNFEYLKVFFVFCLFELKCF